jgi:branched-chain amino acid transport system ATP-binding protein
VTEQPLLVLDNVSKTYGGVRAVDEVSLTVAPGSITALIGPNGAGKSTLFNVVTGFDRAETGAVAFGGRATLGLAPHRLAKRGLVRTFQLTRTFEAISVLDNLLAATYGHPGERLMTALLARRRVGAHEREVRERARELLELFALTDVADAYAGQLSGGQRKLLELARALMLEPTMVLLDEPMAGVNPVLGRRLMEHIHQLREERGLTFFFVEHDMDAVMRHADEVVVMAQGRVLVEGPPAAVQEDARVVDAYLGTAAAPQARRPEVDWDATSPVVLRVEDLVAGYVPGVDILRGVHAEVREGEIVTIVGPNGAGKSTLVKSLVGILRPRAGRIVLRGEEITGLSGHEIVHKGVAYVPQRDNVFPSLTVEENLELGALRRSGTAVEDRIAEVVALFPVLGKRGRQQAGSLSGGERQMLALGRALMAEPAVLLLDEPSAGLSPALVGAMFEKIVEVNAAGVTILMVEQNARQALALSSRGYVLDVGQNRFEGRGSELLDDPQVGRLYLGGGGRV